MGMNLGIQRTTYAPNEDQSWLGSAHGTQECDSITLNGDAFLTAFPTGVVPSGVVVAKKTSTGLYEPYGGTTEEVQTITEGGSGLTSFTLTYSGQTTASIDDDATAADVQAALEALSNIAPGDVVVTGGPLGTGPMTVTFGGTLADTNVAQMTATPTGGTGTVTIATTTAGGAEGGTGGLETAAGHLFTTVDLGGTTAGTVGNTGAALFWHGEVVVAKLPTGHGLDAAARAELTHIHYV